MNRTSATSVSPIPRASTIGRCCSSRACKASRKCPAARAAACSSVIDASASRSPFDQTEGDSRSHRHQDALHVANRGVTRRHRHGEPTLRYVHRCACVSFPRAAPALCHRPWHEKVADRPVPAAKTAGSPGGVGSARADAFGGEASTMKRMKPQRVISRLPSPHAHTLRRASSNNRS